jgi:hypothetical protein
LLALLGLALGFDSDSFLGASDDLACGALGVLVGSHVPGPGLILLTDPGGFLAHPDQRPAVAAILVIPADRQLITRAIGLGEPEVDPDPATSLSEPERPLPTPGALAEAVPLLHGAQFAHGHKLLQVMKERDDQTPLSGVIEVDDAYWGGEHHGGKRGRGSPNKVPFIAALSCDEDNHPIGLRLGKVAGFRKTEVERFAKRHFDPNAIVRTDGLSCFSGQCFSQSTTAFRR